MLPYTLSRQTIVFDLDGTLVDTAVDLIDTLNRILTAEGLPTVPTRSLRHRVGDGVRVMIDQAARYHKVTLAASKVEKMASDFLAIYAQTCTARSSVFPEVIPTLTALRDHGAHLAVCTNKHGNLARKIIDSLGLADYFSAVVGGDDVTNNKPHGDHLATTVARAGGSIRRTLMIGDSGSDVATARNCQAKVILVDYGYSSIPVRLLGADSVVSSFGDIPTVAARLIPSST